MYILVIYTAYVLLCLPHFVYIFDLQLSCIQGRTSTTRAWCLRSSRATPTSSTTSCRITSTASDHLITSGAGQCRILKLFLLELKSRIIVFAVKCRDRHIIFYNLFCMFVTNIIEYLSLILQNKLSIIFIPRENEGI